MAQVGEKDVEVMIQCGGPTLTNLMQKVISDQLLLKEALPNADHRKFLADASARAIKDFRGKLTPKQEDYAKSLLLKPPVLELLTHLMNEPESEIAEPPKSVTAKEPAPAFDYAADPEWGLF